MSSGKSSVFPGRFSFPMKGSHYLLGLHNQLEGLHYFVEDSHNRSKGVYSILEDLHILLPTLHCYLYGLVCIL